MSSTYREWAAKAVSGIRCLREGLGADFVGVVFGLLPDILTEAAQACIQVTLLTDDQQPDDAMALIGAERRLPRYAGETRLQYQRRLREAADLYDVAGDESSIIDQLEAAGWEGVRIYDPWMWSGHPPTGYWSQFWVFFPYGSYTFAVGETRDYNDFAWGDGALWGPIQDAAAVRTIKAIIRKWKPVDWVCRKIIVEGEGWSYGTGHTWGEADLVFGGENYEIGAA